MKSKNGGGGLLRLFLLLEGFSLLEQLSIATSYIGYKSYKLPISVMKALERIMANFIWKGRMHACSWDSMLQTKVRRRHGDQKVGGHILCS